MQKIMATVSGADVTSIKLLTSGLGFTEKRDALFNLLRHRAVPLDQIDPIQSYLEALQTFTPLRNDITHSVWIEGKPQNSIWPVWLKAGPLTARAMSRLMLKGAKRASLVENLRSLRGLDKVRVR